MPRPAITWVTSDTHFYHDALVGMRPEGFTDLILREFKRHLLPQDTLIHLGDVIFYKYPALKGMLDLTPCRKILTLGNHDRKKRGWYERNGFHAAVDGFLLGEIWFTHKPDPGRFPLNIHGHLHSNTGGETDCRCRLVALEYTGYKPVNLEALK